MTYEEIEKIAKRKLKIAINRELTEKEETDYLNIFIDDIINNLAYTRAILNYKGENCYEKIS